jgi:outer membrane translocation and assembly module TamA
MISTALLIAGLAGALFAFGEAGADSETLPPARAPETRETRVIALLQNPFLNRIIGPGDGWRIALGGLMAGQGFALGPEYRRSDLFQGELQLRTSLRASFKKSYLADFELQLPRLAGGKAFLDFSTAHGRYTDMEYFGQGPKSRIEDRTAFQLEDTSVQLRVGGRATRKLKAGMLGAFTAVNVGPSTYGRVVPPGTPGGDRQTSFVHGGGFLEFDYRDTSYRPTRGGNYTANYQWFSDRNLGLHDFRRLELDAQQYIPHFSDKRVIALRAKTVLTDAPAGNVVPFYMQPTLGGGDSLRGFEQFRFYGDNSLLLTGEYRFKVLSNLDTALFVDAGKVFPRWRQLNLKDLETSAGFGFRFNVRNRVFLRLDTAFSREGYQVWLRFNNIF